jgi:hypothetical protein
MIPRPRRTAPSPPITRHFEFTRFHNQLIERAYHVLIPVVSRPLEQSPRSRAGAHPQTSATTPNLRSQARGA